MKKTNLRPALRLCALVLAAALTAGCSAPAAQSVREAPAVSVTLTEERPMPIPHEQGRGEPIEDLVPLYAEEYLADPLLKDAVVAFRRWEWNKVYSQLDTVVSEHPDHLDAYRLQAEVYLINQNYEAALSQLDQILRRDITDLHALGVSSIVLHLLGNTEGEQERLAALEQLCPAAAQAVADMLAQADALLYAPYSSQPQTDTQPDAIAVYGQTPKKNGTPSAGMLSRLERALEMAQKYPEAKLILSGGDVRTPYTEASVMEQWLLEQGVEPERIILDEKARDTYGNAIGTLEALQQMEADSVLIIGTMLHLPRAVTTTTLYAQHLGYPLAIDSAGGGETAVLDEGEVRYAYVNAARASGLFTKEDYAVFAGPEEAN